MRIIIPIFAKLYEILIIDKFINYIPDIIIKENYQWGGIKNGFSFKVMYNLRLKTNRSKYKCDFLEMAKGYDSINLKLLEDMTSKIDDNRMRTLLLNCISIFKNMDLEINYI